MADEKAVDVRTEASSSDETSGSSEGQKIRDSRSSFFSSETRPSENDLIAGEWLPGGEEKPKEEVEEQEEDEDEGKPKEEAKEEAKVEDKPPPGYVPLSALQEERAAKRRLTNEIAELKSKLRKAPKAQKTETPRSAEATDFDQFTKEAEEVEKSIDDGDPLEGVKRAVKLFKKLPSVLSKMREAPPAEEKSEEAGEEDDEEVVQEVIRDGMTLMERLVPGITDSDGSDVNRKLSAFAYSNDIPKTGVLPIITNPGTLVKPPKGEARYLGDDAAYIVSFLNKACALSEAATGDKISPESEKKLLEKYAPQWRKEIEEKVTKELTAKMKGGAAPRSISELPGEAPKSESGIFSNRVSESDYSRMTKEEKDKYLFG